MEPTAPLTTPLVMATIHARACALPVDFAVPVPPDLALLSLHGRGSSSQAVAEDWKNVQQAMPEVTALPPACRYGSSERYQPSSGTAEGPKPWAVIRNVATRMCTQLYTQSGVVECLQVHSANYLILQNLRAVSENNARVEQAVLPMLLGVDPQENERLLEQLQRYPSTQDQLRDLMKHLEDSRAFVASEPALADTDAQMEAVGASD